MVKYNGDLKKLRSTITNIFNATDFKVYFKDNGEEDYTGDNSFGAYDVWSKESREIKYIYMKDVALIVDDKLYFNEFSLSIENMIIQNHNLIFYYVEETKLEEIVTFFNTSPIIEDLKLKHQEILGKIKLNTKYLSKNKPFTEQDINIVYVGERGYINRAKIEREKRLLRDINYLYVNNKTLYLTDLKFNEYDKRKSSDKINKSSFIGKYEFLEAKQLSYSDRNVELTNLMTNNKTNIKIRGNNDSVTFFSKAAFDGYMKGFDTLMFNSFATIYDDNILNKKYGMMAKNNNGQILETYDATNSEKSTSLLILMIENIETTSEIYDYKNVKETPENIQKISKITSLVPTERTLNRSTYSEAIKNHKYNYVAFRAGDYSKEKTPKILLYDTSIGQYVTSINNKLAIYDSNDKNFFSNLKNMYILGGPYNNSMYYSI